MTSKYIDNVEYTILLCLFLSDEYFCFLGDNLVYKIVIFFPFQLKSVLVFLVVIQIHVIVVIVSFLIDLLVVLMKLSLAIWTIPVEKNYQRDDKNDIWNRNAGDYGANHLARIVSFQNNPGIDSGVITWKSIISFENILA